MKTVRDWQREVHAVAVDRGWWDEYDAKADGTGYIVGTRDGIEIADTIIRLLDTAAALGIDVEQMMEIKHEYNRGVPPRREARMKPITINALSITPTLEAARKLVLACERVRVSADRVLPLRHLHEAERRLASLLGLELDAETGRYRDD